MQSLEVPDSVEESAQEDDEFSCNKEMSDSKF